MSDVEMVAQQTSDSFKALEAVRTALKEAKAKAA